MNDSIQPPFHRWQTRKGTQGKSKGVFIIESDFSETEYEARVLWCQQNRTLVSEGTRRCVWVPDPLTTISGTFTSRANTSLPLVPDDMVSDRLSNLNVIPHKMPNGSEKPNIIHILLGYEH